MFETMAAITADGPWHGAGGGPFPFFLIPLLWLLLLAGIVVAVVISRRRHDHRAGLRAGEAVLAERFASGDIEAAEYAARLQVLRQR